MDDLTWPAGGIPPAPGRGWQQGTDASRTGATAACRRDRLWPCKQRNNPRNRIPEGKDLKQQNSSSTFPFTSENTDNNYEGNTHTASPRCPALPPGRGSPQATPLPVPTAGPVSGHCSQGFPTARPDSGLAPADVLEPLAGNSQAARGIFEILKALN